MASQNLKKSRGASSFANMEHSACCEAEHLFPAGLWAAENRPPLDALHMVLDLLWTQIAQQE
jgi:hypothetical protein